MERWVWRRQTVNPIRIEPTCVVSDQGPFGSFKGEGNDLVGNEADHDPLADFDS